MFNSHHTVCKVPSSPLNPKLKTILCLFTLVFMALALSSPLLATDPIDVDPDPDYGPITQIVVESMDQVDLETLSPGVYWIVVVHEDGPNETYEIVVT